jgi:hypothetical protein
MSISLDITIGSCRNFVQFVLLHATTKTS